MGPMMENIEAMWRMDRDIVSDGYDAALDYIAKQIPLSVHSVPSGTDCWTWTIPEKWACRAAYIKDGTRTLVDLKDHPLHVVRYSLAKKGIIRHSELMAHLHTDPNRPDAIPYVYKYYRRDWGFCVPHSHLGQFRAKEYEVCIDSEFVNGAIKIGECLIPGEVRDCIVIVAHLDHPGMVNDDLTGVVVAVEIAKELLKKKNHYTYRILFVSETIGSIAYLATRPEVVRTLKYGVFLEMLGNTGSHSLQFSRQNDTYVDRVFHHVLRHEGHPFNVGAFRKVVCNDEMVFNGPGMDIPMVSLSRWDPRVFPGYPEYHTSDDNPSIVTESRLEESKNVVLKALRILDSDFVPCRTFVGPAFLSKYGLWPDGDNALATNVESIMLNLEGKTSVFDITEKTDLPFDVVHDYVTKFVQAGLARKLPAEPGRT